MTFESLKDTDSGNYSCHVNNALGSVSHTATLSIRCEFFWTFSDLIINWIYSASPKFITRPSDIEIAEGRDADILVSSLRRAEA